MLGSTRANHPKHPIAGLDEGHEGVANQLGRRRAAQVERGVDRRRLAQHQVRGVGQAQRDRAHPRVPEQLAFELGRDHAVGRGLKRQRRLVGGG